MALSGQLDEMNLLEIFQIIAFSKKSGTLSVESPTSRGAVLFREGRVQCALSSTTSDALRALSRETFDASRVDRLQSYIRLALEELVGLREGFFEFSIQQDAPLTWQGLDVGNFLLTDGIDPEALLLDLAHELDESRRESRRLLEAEEEGDEEQEDADAASFPGSGFTVLVVDDEDQVTHAVREAIANTGTTVDIAERVGEALGLIRSLHAAGRPMALVADVGMPSLDGESFLGGLDLAEQVREIDARLPILLMAESLTAKARARAKRLGIRKVAFKPALTKLDPEEYEMDLRSFAETIVSELETLVASKREPVERETSPPLNLEAIFGFLRQMTEQLNHPGNAIARMVLRVASKFSERVLVFLVKQSTACGLAGVQAGRADRQVSDELRRVSIALQDVQPFAEVVYSRRTTRCSHEPGLTPPGIGRGRATEFVLLPLVLNHEVVAIIYVDNPASGRRLTNLAGLEMFLTQAGMAMDNVSLQKKVRAASAPFSIENQGPLTQELTRVIPSSK